MSRSINKSWQALTLPLKDFIVTGGVIMLVQFIDPTPGILARPFAARLTSNAPFWMGGAFMLQAVHGMLMTTPLSIGEMHFGLPQLPLPSTIV